MRFSRFTSFLRTFSALTVFTTSSRAFVSAPCDLCRFGHHLSPCLPFPSSAHSSPPRAPQAKCLSRTSDQTTSGGRFCQEVSPASARQSLLGQYANVLQQSSSASFARRAPRRRTLASTTSTLPRKASTRARPATLRCTRRSKSSSPAAAGPPTSTASRAP